jgi:hypothetical protein
VGDVHDEWWEDIKLYTLIVMYTGSMSSHDELKIMNAWILLSNYLLKISEKNSRRRPPRPLRPFWATVDRYNWAHPILGGHLPHGGDSDLRQLFAVFGKICSPCSGEDTSLELF